MRRLLGAVALLSSLAGCGWNVGTAREAAAQHSCSWYNKCSEIGSGKTYASFDECLTQQRSFWLDAWSTANCGTMNNSATDSCIAAIDNTQCSNALDFLATLSKCTSSSVCK